MNHAMWDPSTLAEMQALIGENTLLRKLLAMYASSNDCPVCFAAPVLVGQTITRRSPNLITHAGGRWEVVHGQACDVGLAMRPSSNGDPK